MRNSKGIGEIVHAECMHYGDWRFNFLLLASLFIRSAFLPIIPTKTPPRDSWLLAAAVSLEMKMDFSSNRAERVLRVLIMDIGYACILYVM